MLDQKVFFKQQESQRATFSESDNIGLIFSSKNCKTKCHLSHKQLKSEVRAELGQKVLFAFLTQQNADL